MVKLFGMTCGLYRERQAGPSLLLTSISGSIRLDLSHLYSAGGSSRGSVHGGEGLVSC